MIRQIKELNNITKKMEKVMRLTVAQKQPGSVSYEGCSITLTDKEANYNKAIISNVLKRYKEEIITDLEDVINGIKGGDDENK